MSEELVLYDTTDLEGVLAKYGYKLVKITRFKSFDRVKVEATYGFLTVNYRKHLEDYTLKEACDGLLTQQQFIKEFHSGGEW